MAPSPSRLVSCCPSAQSEEAGLERCIKAGGADEDVYWILLAIVAYTAALSDPVDLAVDNRDVWLGEGFEVADTRSQATASKRPVGYQFLFQEIVARLLFHLLEHVGLSFLMRLSVFEEEGELAVEPGLSLLAIRKEGARLS